MTTVVFNRVQSRDSRVGLGLGPVLESYQAAQWGGFAFGIVGVLYFFLSSLCGGLLSRLTFVFVGFQLLFLLSCFSEGSV